MDQNQFLRDFIKMRQELRTKQAAYAPSQAKHATSVPLKGTDMPKPSGITFATIIEEKPPKAEVIKFLRQRLENIIDEMSD